MRIGYDATALPERPVGAGVYIIQLARNLASLTGPKQDFELVVFAQRRAIPLLALPEQPGVWVVELPDHPIPVRLIWEQTSLPGLARRERLDLLHSPHYTRPLRLPCRSVVTFHDMTFFLLPQMHTRARRWIFPWMMRLSARRADALIAVSESTRRDAIDILHIPSHKITAVPLAVDGAFRPLDDPPRAADVRQRYHLPERFILYVGTLEPRKNVPLLLRAYRRLMDEGDDPPCLVIVGRQGWMFDEIHHQTQTLKLSERVIFTGYVADSDLPMVYNLADLFVYPSSYEGFGLPPLEAMGCGTPVVTTAISSMPEHVGDAGLLVPPENEPELARAMHAILKDPDLRRQLSRRGIERAADYTWIRTAQRTLNVYRQVLQAPTRRAS
jgi:glycosyltransferase involved in cell wall biosynthesis